MDGADREAIGGEEDLNRFIDIIDRPITEGQRIGLAEAGLIRYFKPKYNEIFKESFPAADQKVLSECYQLDFSALIVEIDTSELGFSLYSDNAVASHHHMAKFDLIDPSVRRSFFTFVDAEGSISKMPDVIVPSR